MSKIYIEIPIDESVYNQMETIAKNETGGDVKKLFEKFVKEGIERKKSNPLCENCGLPLATDGKKFWCARGACKNDNEQFPNL